MSDPVTRILAPTRIDFTVQAGTITTSFLRRVMNRELVGRRCPACEKVYIPPRAACPTCAVPCRDEVTVGPAGTVTTFSVIRIPFEGQLLEPPYAAAHIVLDGADVPLLHIVGGIDVDDVRMGLRVEAVWDDEVRPTFEMVRYFRPNGEPDADYAAFEGHLG